METQTLEMVCPKCNTPYTFAAHPSVSAADGGLTSKLLDLSIFRPTCPACGAKTLVEYPCVWHDDAGGVLVELLPPVAFRSRTRRDTPNTEFCAMSTPPTPSAKRCWRSQTALTTAP